MVVIDGIDGNDGANNETVAADLWKVVTCQKKMATLQRNGDAPDCRRCDGRRRAPSTPGPVL